MREGEFRGKRLDNVEWITGDLIRMSGYTFIFPDPAPNGFDRYMVDPATVGQYTGLKDKTGKDIWGGDVLKWARDGRLYVVKLVMDILHFCMDRGCIIHTVKDRFTLGDDIQSKVLAFAFGLAAEIERQMIRQRTKEGLRLKMKLGVLLGRPIGKANSEEAQKFGQWKDRLKQMVEWQMSPRQIASVIGCDRNTVNRLVLRYGYEKDWKFKTQYAAKTYKAHPRKPTYKDGDYAIVILDREKTLNLIKADLTIPQIAESMPEYTYEQIYDTILRDENNRRP